MNAVEFDLEVAELLVATGIVMSYDLDRCHAALRGGPGLRDLLIQRGATDTHMWAAAVAVTKLVHERTLPRDEARTALNLVGNCAMSIPDALARMGYNAAPKNPWESALKELKESGKYKAAQ